MTHSTRLIRYSLLVVIAAGLGPAAVEAQTSEPLRFTLAAGAGQATPFHGDLEFKAASWEVSARGQAARHFALEGFASEWRHASEAVRFGLPGIGGDGSVGQLTQQTRYTVRTFGLNALPTISFGRVTLTGGGGGGVMIFSRRFEQSVSACRVAGSLACSNLVNRHASSSLTVQGVAGLDVRLAPRLAAFADYRLVFPVDDPGSGHAALAAGVRVGIR